jgi:hypothetical protein
MRKTYRKSQKSRKSRKLRKRQSYKTKQKGGEVAGIPENTLMLKAGLGIDDLAELTTVGKVLKDAAL